MLHSFRLGTALLTMALVAWLSATGAADEAHPIELAPASASDWLIRDGDWQFGEGEMEQTDAARAGVAFLRAAVLDDFTLTVEFNIRPVGDGERAAAVIFRATGTRTFYRLHFDTQAACAVLVQSRPGETWNGLARKAATVTPDFWHKLTLDCRGPEITVSLDDQPVL